MLKCKGFRGGGQKVLGRYNVSLPGKKKMNWTSATLSLKLHTSFKLWNNSSHILWWGSSFNQLCVWTLAQCVPLSERNSYERWGGPHVTVSVQSEMTRNCRWCCICLSKSGNPTWLPVNTHTQTHTTRSVNAQFWFTGTTDRVEDICRINVKVTRFRRHPQ